jgi:hypothetical protein
MTGTSEVPRIDWTSAEVEDGALTVTVSGQKPKGWVKRVEGVLALLDLAPSGRWGEIAVRKRAIEVAGVQEGSEEDLRQLLDGALLQVASDYGLELHEQAGAPGRDANAERERRMTERFRSFAQD